MALIESIRDRILSQLSSFLEPVITPLQKLWTILKGFFTAIIQVVPETIDLIKLVESEVLEWKNFKQSINFKQGVVNLQSVRNHVQDLIQELIDAWNGIQDLISQITHPQSADSPFEDAQAAAEELEATFKGLGKIGLSDFLKTIGPKLEKAGGKLFEALAILQAVSEKLLAAVHDLRAIVIALQDIRTTFETGEGLFLKQTNLRRIVTLNDGSKMKIRIGNLHN